jgi:hypothetical protein
MHLPLFLTATAFAFLARPASAAVIHCSDMTAVSATSGWSTVQKDLSIDKKPITLGGKVYPKGLGTHAPSEIVYTLNGKYAAFTADVGIDDETAGKGSVEFQVFADDSLIYKSGVMKGNAAAKKISVSVAGKNRLKLAVTIGPDTYDMDDADWAAPQLVEKDPVALSPSKASRPDRGASAGYAAPSGTRPRDIQGRLKRIGTAAGGP